MFKRLTLTALVLGVSLVLFSQVSADTLPEKYVKKVIIDAKWGNGPGEFGMDTLSDPPAGPSGFILDRDENIFIYDYGNGRIYKFNSKGELEKELDIKKDNIYSFTVKNDTIYGLVFTGLNPIEKIKMIDIKTEKVIKTLEFSLPESDNPLNIENEDGDIILSRGKEKYKIARTNSSNKIMHSPIKNIKEVLPKPIFRRVTQTKGEFIVGGHKFLISKDLGNNLFDAKLIGKDKKGNFYIEVFSESQKKSPSSAFREIREIFKFSPQEKLLMHIELPLKNIVSGGIQIGPYGDIYYLYATGKIIEKDWKIHFIPGKVQVIKWELQR